MIDANELIRDLQTMRDGGFLSDSLLRHAVKKIASAEARFDWVGVYLLNSEEGELWLHNYVGSPTDHPRIAVGEGVCGTAVAEGANQIVSDVSEIENYIACDPAVRSEMVVLIRAGEEVLGQIDIDSHQKGAFTMEEEAAIQAVADKLAEQMVSERRPG